MYEKWDTNVMGRNVRKLNMAHMGSGKQAHNKIYYRDSVAQSGEGNIYSLEYAKWLNVKLLHD
jgi:hypothetical protein